MKKLINILFISGILGFIIYIAHVVIGGILWNGYDHLRQPISDLTASGAPNRDFMLVFTTIYGILMILFSFSACLKYFKKGTLSLKSGVAGTLLLFVVSFLYNFFPEDLPGHAMTVNGFMHIAITALIVPLSFLSPLLFGIGIRKIQGNRNLGIYSILSGILIFIFGGSTAIAMAARFPYFGLLERLNIGTLLVWTVVLSLWSIRNDYSSKICNPAD